MVIIAGYNIIHSLDSVCVMGNLNASAFLRLGLILAMAICHTCHSCSPPMHWKSQEVSKRAASAEIVIVGKVVRRRTSERKNGLYGASIEVLCVLKAAGSGTAAAAPFPTIVEVLGFGQVAGHCVHSAALQNATYIGFLRQHNGRYFVAEVNSQPGTIPFERAVLRSIAKEIGTRHRRCLNVLAESHRNATKHRMVVYRDEMKTNTARKTKTEMTRERTRPPPPPPEKGLKDGSSAAAFKAKLPIWGVATMLTAMYLSGWSQA